jgi:putative ABC transport system substrate-binding protein
LTPCRCCYRLNANPLIPIGKIYLFAMVLGFTSLTLLNRKRVIDYAAEHRLPAIYEQDFVTRDGGLMSYGADQRESFDRAAALADRIFKGAKPADLPVEQPTR